MTIELVDGHGGKPHISGEDLGDFKAGILGDAGYVFKRANMLAATLNGSNSITIATGSGIMPTSGRHFRVTAPETLTITSGTQGQKRNDLIVVRAKTDEKSTTVETATLVVLRGTPTSGTATDPATQAGDLPLYRLQLTGVSVAEPIALFAVMVPYSEFRDSISPVEITLTPNSGTTPTLSSPGCFAIPALRMCFIHCHASGLKGNMSALRNWTVATIEKGYEPSIPIDLYGSADNNSNMSFSLWSDGQIVAKALDKATPAGTGFSFSGFWTY